MAIDIEVKREPCTLYPTCPFTMEGVDRLGGGGETEPELPRCRTNCLDTYDPKTELWKWKKID